MTEPFTVTDKRASATIRTVKAWTAMSPQEQAEHLVRDHGFDDDLFGTSPGLLDLLYDKERVIEAFAGTDLDYAAVIKAEADKTGDSYPWHESRDGWHEGDHNGDGTTIGGDYADSGLADTVGLHIHMPSTS